MNNFDLSQTWRYHDGTKHSHQSVMANRHYMDWTNQPSPFKIYTSLDPIPLPNELPESGVSALEAMANTQAPRVAEVLPDRATLARLCYFSNGVTKIIRRGHGEMAFRAAACTGALYHVELYLVCGPLSELEAGVYHYGAHDHALRQLRAGDFRGVVVEASGGEPAVARAPAIVVTTSTFWRNAWKYQARAYRHAFWDTGTILANLEAVACAARLPTRVTLGFADAPVNALLGLDPARETAICVIPIGRASEAPAAPPRIGKLDLPTERLSPREVDYPAIREAHQASSLAAGEEAAAWRGAPPSLPLPEPAGRVVTLRPIPEEEWPANPLEAVIRRRGSARQFAREPIPFGHLSTMLDRTSRGVETDFMAPSMPSLSHVYLIAHAVDGLEPGAYVFHPNRSALELLKAGDFRLASGRLALGQELAADAAANVYFLSPLEPVLAHLGNRGYRAAQLSSAIIAGRLYLAAYALRLGATGLTFFDDEVTNFFSPHAAGKSVMFLVALGKPLKRG